MNSKTCDLCIDEHATTLCFECHKCYCDECNCFIHKKRKFEHHKTETITEGITFNEMCPLHNKEYEMFCVDEVKLYCSECKKEKNHVTHKLIKITDIQKDNEIFSTRKVRTLFKDSLRWENKLENDIITVLRNIQNMIIEKREEVKQTFDEEHKKLYEEEAKVLGELEDTGNKVRNYFKTT